MSVVRPLSAPDAARDLDALRVRLRSADEAAELRPIGSAACYSAAGSLIASPTS